MQRLAGFINRQRHHNKLHVSALIACMLCARQASYLPRTDGQWAAIIKEPLQAHLGKLKRIAHLIIDRHLLFKFNDHARLIVILQVFTHLR